MKLSDFDFDLPERLIALRPARPRPASRMLVARGCETEDCQVRDLPGRLRAGDLLVFNDTRVIPARLFGERQRGSSDGSGDIGALERAARISHASSLSCNAV
jgi:S-adenosylmethionine:tRNA ribosyltransferase-isomerase